MGTRLKGLPEGGMGGRKDTPRCFNTKKTAILFLFPGGLGAQRIKPPFLGSLAEPIPKE